MAATCVEANIASTAAIVMGKDAVSWLESHRLPARLVDQEGNVHRVAGWPQPALYADTFESGSHRFLSKLPGNWISIDQT